MAKSRCSRPSPIVGLMPDVHAPDHNPRAVEWAIDSLLDLGLAEMVFLGDLLNMDGASRFRKSLKMRQALPKEIQEGVKFLGYLAKKFEGVEKVTYLLGNHEARLHQYLLRNAPELADLPELIFRRLMKIPPHWQVVPYGDYVKRQGVLLQHGRKFSNAASRSNILLGCSSVQGHSHRVQMVSHRFAGTGKRIVAAELGCLCNFSPNYSKLTDWCHAYGYIQNGQVHVVARGGSA